MNFLDILYVLSYISAKGKHGQLKKFVFPNSPMWKIEETLREYGVAVYARGFEGKNKTFMVSEKQAEYAEYLCLAAGFPKIGIDYPKNISAIGKGLPKKKWEKGGRKRSFLNSLGKFLSWFG